MLNRGLDMQCSGEGGGGMKVLSSNALSFRLL